MTDDQHAALSILDDQDITVEPVDHTMVDGKLVEVPGFGFSVRSAEPLTEEQWALIRRCVARPFESKAERTENGQITRWFRFVG